MEANPWSSIQRFRLHICKELFASGWKNTEDSHKDRLSLYNISNIKTLKKNTVSYCLIVVYDIFIAQVLKVLYFCQHIN